MEREREQFFCSNTSNFFPDCKIYKGNVYNGDGQLRGEGWYYEFLGIESAIGPYPSKIAAIMACRSYMNI